MKYDTIFVKGPAREGIPGRVEPPLYGKEPKPYKIKPPRLQYTRLCHTEYIFKNLVWCVKKTLQLKNIS